MNEPATSRRTQSSQLRRLVRLATKELVEILRDRRTIITLVLMPLLVYPLMGVVVQKLLLQSLTGQQEVVYNIGFADEADLLIFKKEFQRGEETVRRLLAAEALEQSNGRDSDAESGNTMRLPIEPDDKPDLNIMLTEGKMELSELVKERISDISIVVHSGQRLGSRFEILYDPTSKFSFDAMQYVGRRLRLASDGYYRQLARQSSSPGSYVETEVETEASQPSLLTFVPLMLVLMTITGAVYPAIDLTAGERERGTMEILVAAPISKLSILIGKFVAVLVVAILTAIANLVAMVVTVYTLGLDAIIFGEGGMNLGTFGVIFLLLIVLAAFFSAVLLGLTSFARSFKEAQAYLIPLMLVAFAPGLLSLTPNLQTTSSLAVIPLVNIVLVGRDLLAGNASAILVAITIVSTIMYGLMALAFASRVFGKDSILTGGLNGWTDLFSRGEEIRDTPEFSTAMTFLAVLFPGFIVVSGLVMNFANRTEASISQMLLCNALVTFLLFVGLPWLFSVLAGLKKSTTFMLIRPSVLSAVGAGLIGCAVWTLAYELEIVSLSRDRVKEFLGLFETMKLSLNEVSLPVKLLCLALVPAVCEELTFRGFLMSAFLKRMPVVIAVLITAFLFGMFHVFVRDALMFERMIPSTFMGILLGYVCVRSGSVIPGIILHVIHNGLLITIAHNELRLQQWGIGMSEQEHLPIQWIGLALIPIVLGFILLHFAARHAKTVTDVGSDTSATL